ncbi:unnamed protein product, partial [Anisakis simplex]|uniref:Uncharacterized protein n=1 Tax=Anisakis simplex TaxID=6269 RepID=A0A0M3KK08_ANISI
MLGKSRGGHSFRPYSPGRTNLLSLPPPNVCYRQPSSFYHGTQKNAKVHEMMFRLRQVAYEQLRRSGAALLRQKGEEEKIKYLERVGYLFCRIYYPMSADVTLNVEVPYDDH